MEERKIKSKIITLTVCAVLLVFVLLGLLVFQYINYWKLTAQNLELTRQLDALKVERQNLENEVDYKSSEEFIEDYAREVLGWGRENETYYD